MTEYLESGIRDEMKSRTLTNYDKIIITSWIKGGSLCTYCLVQIKEAFMDAATVFYAIFGLVGVTVNMIVAVAISRDKKMQNATYRFMVHLAIADVFVVFGLLVGPSIGRLLGFRISADDAAGKIFAYFNGFGYHGTTLFMIIVSLSRWVHFAKKHLTGVWFGRSGHRVICVSVWVFVLLFLSPFLYYPDAFMLIPNTGVYLYTNSTYSSVLQNFDEVVNVVAALAQIMFNLMTIKWIAQLRKQVLTPELKARNKQELKLFVLCAIDSSVYCLLIAVHYYSLYGGSNEVIGVLLEILFLSNHVDCAVLYLCLNSNLRSAIANFVRVNILRKKDNVVQVHTSTAAVRFQKSTTGQTPVTISAPTANTVHVSHG